MTTKALLLFDVVLACLFLVLGLCIGHGIGDDNKYDYLCQYEQEHITDNKYYWNEQGDIQHNYTVGPIYHVESVAGGHSVLGVPDMKEATAAELEDYIKARSK